MEPTDFRYRHHPSTCRRQDSARLWTIHGQRKMGSPAMVIRQVASQDTLEVALMEDDHVVQTLPADTPNQSLDKRILPWTPWGDHDLLDPHMLYPLSRSE